MVIRTLRCSIGWPAKTQLPLLLAAFLFGNLLAVLFTVFQQQKLPPPTTTYRQQGLYSYEETVAANGVKLYSLQTAPQNIQLKHIATNVTRTPYVGINGGFFWQGQLLSIAVAGDEPLKGRREEYGSGWYNIDYPKGTLVWDEIAGRFSVQIVQDANELKVTDRQRYWAQGGVSMSLQRESEWKRQALAEAMPAFDKPKLRSGAVYDDRQNLWLVVTDTPSTAEQFRAAIMETIGGGKLVDGIFLDGDGSSQLNSTEKKLKGDSREVYQMIGLKQQ